MKSYQQLFAELKRRHVFKVTAVYGAVAFALIQVADPLAKALLLPDAFLTYVAAILLLGFPLALVLTWAFEVTPQGVRRTEPAAPEEIAAIVAQPASKRWPSGLLALLGIAALVAGAWWVGRRSGAADVPSGADARLALAAPEDDERPSIAVLPFEDMSAEGDQEYFSDGMTEEILNTLAKIPDLRVSARTSAFAFKEHALTAVQLGDTLRVKYLVEGSVRKAGNQLRITAQLIDTTDGSHVWSEQYDRELEDVFAIQTEIAEAIADELRVPLGLEAGEALVTPTGDLDAYDLYLAGRSQMRLRGEGLREAISLFETAIAHDSTWAPAWAALAEANEITIWHAQLSLGIDDADFPTFVDSAQARAERAARRALELDPDNASALVALGSVQRNRAEWEASAVSYRRAIALDPDNAEAHQQYADLMYNMGRIDEAVREADRAWALDPASIRAETLAWSLVLDGRFEEAADVCTAALARAPDVTRERLLSHCLRTRIEAGHVEQALDDLGELVRLGTVPRFSRDSWERDRPMAEAVLRALDAGTLDGLPAEVREEITAEDFDYEQWMMVGEPDSALAVLLEHDPPVAFGRTAQFWHPLLDPLRSHPRVQAWLADRGLGGVEVQRTPENQRIRPMILREAGAAP